MNKTKKIILILLTLTLCLGLFACKKDNGEGSESDGTVVEDLYFLEHNLVRPEKTSEKLLDDLSVLYDHLILLSGKSNGFSDDMLIGGAEPDPNAKEILVGHTNRPETEQVLSQLSGSEWAVAVVGNKVVIVGMTDSITPTAIQYFTNTYLGDGATGKLPGDLFYKSSADTAVIVDKNQPVYRLVRSYGADEGTVDMMYKVSDVIMDISGIMLDVGTDRLNTGESYSSETYEILFGDTAYAETEKVKATVDPNSYSIQFVGNKIVIFAWNVEALEEAVDSFADMLTFACYKSTDGVATVSVVKENITRKVSDASYYLDVPVTVDGKVYDKVYDCYDGAVMLYWENATEAMMDTYVSALESDSFEKYQSLDNTSIKSATYKKDSAAVHVYYLKNTHELRVVTQDNAPLPINATQYEKICDVAVTQLGLDYVTDSSKSGGMGYLIRLEDGTFAVIDGGDPLDTNAENLYRLMVDQKPGGVTDIIIRAWIITHGHGDHYGVYNLFAQNYADKVTVETLVGNDPPEYIHENCDTPGHSFNYARRASAFKNCKYIKAHTGQQLQLPGFTFTILQTHEDVFPDGPLTKFNSNASMIFDGVAAYDGTRFIWLADMESEGAKIFKDIYYSDMKCDVLQMAHHGVKGATQDVYEFCNPDIAFWPASQAILDGQYGKLAQNVWLKNNVDKMIVSADGNYTIWFGESESVDIGGAEGAVEENENYSKYY